MAGQSAATQQPTKRFHCRQGGDADGGGCSDGGGDGVSKDLSAGVVLQKIYEELSDA
jgi:hypothetical protein